ncbi:MAG: hypothetical protein Q4A84_01915 [Neisseria sp.]|uniref:hypothetical protein n=1 Tax=Neisseria sp. TaxID=192066 RepID=UPI0026DB7F8E|nr:hypothetical protein [Neisseria sp.]MDO4640447.1 hypothetical protein [Neisseria sp.]
MHFSLLSLATAALLFVWFLITIIWGSIWLNLITLDQSDKGNFLGEKAKSAADRLGLSMLRFPVFHLILWLADVVGWCYAALFWWQK